MRSKHKRAFTLIEVLVVIGIIAILAGVVLVAVNPARQFKMARDSQRVSNVNAILNAVGQNIAEHKGSFICAGTPRSLPATSTLIRSSQAGDPSPYEGDIASCLIPDYISSLPFDPSGGSYKYLSIADYNSGYSVFVNTEGKVTVSAVPELSPSINVSR